MRMYKLLINIAILRASGIWLHLVIGRFVCCGYDDDTMLYTLIVKVDGILFKVRWYFLAICSHRICCISTAKYMHSKNYTPSDSPYMYVYLNIQTPSKNTLLLILLTESGSIQLTKADLLTQRLVTLH